MSDHADALELLHEVHARSAAMLDELRALKPELERLQALPDRQQLLDDASTLEAAQLVLARLVRDQNDFERTSTGLVVPFVPDYAFKDALRDLGQNPWKWDNLIRGVRARAEARKKGRAT